MPGRRLSPRALVHPGVGAGAVVVAVLAVGPPLLSRYWVGFLLGVFVMVSLATSYDILGGFAGYLNLGHATFFGVGAYAFTILAGRDVAVPLALIAAVVAPVLLALVAGPPLLRLRGVYFAIAAFGLVVLFRVLAYNFSDLTGGAAGLTLITAIEQRTVYWALLALAAAAVLITFALTRSRAGLALEAIREDEEVAEAFGVRPGIAKLAAMALSAAIAGLTGALYAVDVFFIGPETVFGLTIALTPIVMALVGGSGVVGGPLLGAVLLFTLSEQARALIGEYSLLFYGVVLTLTGLFMPGGALRLLRARQRRARRRRAVPASPVRAP
ncbi:branched-chain amino acid ABC transporter permease [soil metagenome]